MIANTQYTKNFLAKVICRVDFGTPLVKYRTDLPEDLINLIKGDFPLLNPLESFTQEVVFQVSKSPDIKTEVTEKIWKFISKDKRKALTFSSSYIILEYDKYSKSEEIEKDIFPISKYLFDNHSDLVISRTGIRYINHINLNPKYPLVWKDYISNNLISFLKFYDNPSEVSRAIGILEFAFGFFNLKFQFGMPNPDYPARIFKKFFILDLDAYSNDALVNYSDLEIYLKAYIKKSKEIFELSIKDKLRGLMNE